MAGRERRDSAAWPWLDAARLRVAGVTVPPFCGSGPGRLYCTWPRISILASPPAAFNNGMGFVRVPA